MDYREFAKEIKTKYPQYADRDDKELSTAMLEKYPQYRSKVNNVEQDLGINPLNDNSLVEDVRDVTGANIASGATSLAGSTAEVVDKGIGMLSEIGGALGNSAYRGVGNIAGIFSDDAEEAFDKIGAQFYQNSLPLKDFMFEAGKEINNLTSQAGRDIKDEILEQNTGYQNKLRDSQKRVEAGEKEFKLSDIGTKDFLLYDLYGGLVENAPIMVASIGSGGSTAIGKSGTLANYISSALGATAFSTSVNASREAESTYDQALEEGLSPEEAFVRSERVFSRNFKANSGSELIQMGLIFMPAGSQTAPFWKQALKTLGRYGGAGALEVGQERIEDNIQSQAGNENFDLGSAIDDLTKKGITRTDAISFLLGVGFQGAGNVMTSDKSLDKSMEQFAGYAMNKAGAVVEKGTSAKDALLNLFKTNPAQAEQAVKDAQSTIQKTPENIRGLASQQDFLDSAVTEGKSVNEIALELSKNIEPSLAKEIAQRAVSGRTTEVDNQIVDFSGVDNTVDRAFGETAPSDALADTNQKFDEIKDQSAENIDVSVASADIEGYLQRIESEVAPIDQKIEELQQSLRVAEPANRTVIQNEINTLRQEEAGLRDSIDQEIIGRTEVVREKMLEFVGRQYPTLNIPDTLMGNLVVSAQSAQSGTLAEVARTEIDKLVANGTLKPTKSEDSLQSSTKKEEKKESQVEKNKKVDTKDETKDSKGSKSSSKKTAKNKAETKKEVKKTENNQVKKDAKGSKKQVENKSKKDVIVFDGSKKSNDFLQKKVNEGKIQIEGMTKQEGNFKEKERDSNAVQAIDEQTQAEATAFLEDYKKRFNVDFDTVWVDSIYANKDRGIFADGMTYDNTVVLARDLSRFTAEHEIVHLTLANIGKIDAFKGMSKKDILEAQAEKMGLELNKETEVQIEEKLARDFEAYMSNKLEPRGIIRRFFAKLKKMLLNFARAIKMSDLRIIDGYFDILATGRSATQQVIEFQNKGLVRAFIDEGNIDASRLYQAPKFKTREEELVSPELKALYEDAVNYDSAQEFYDAYTADDLLDLSNPEKHRFGRLLEDGVNEDTNLYENVAEMAKYYGSAGINQYKYEPEAKVPDTQNPDEMVTIYRGTVPEQESMQVGDFVSFSKEYALSHNDGQKLLTLEVPARDVVWQGNDLHEWIYSPESVRGATYDGGLKAIWGDATNSESSIEFSEVSPDRPLKNKLSDEEYSEYSEDIRGAISEGEVFEDYVDSALHRGEFESVEDAQTLWDFVEQNNSEPMFKLKREKKSLNNVEKKYNEVIEHLERTEDILDSRHQEMAIRLTQKEDLVNIKADYKQSGTTDLAKFVGKDGNLPDINPEGKTKFEKEGDQILKTLKYETLEDARSDIEAYMASKAQLMAIRKEISTIRTSIKTTKSGEADLKKAKTLILRKLRVKERELAVAERSYSSGEKFGFIEGKRFQNAVIKARKERREAEQAPFKEIEKVHAKLKKAVKNGKGIDVKYQKILLELFEDYDFKQPTSKTMERLLATKQYIESVQGTAQDVRIPDYLMRDISRLSKRPLKSLTKDEIIELNTTIMRLYQNGVSLYKMKQRRDKREFEKDMDALLDSTIDGGKKKVDINFTLDAGRVADALDGVQNYFGMNYQLIVNPAVNAEMEAEIQTNEILGDTFKKLESIANDTYFTDERRARMVYFSAIEQGGRSQAQALRDEYVEYDFDTPLNDKESKALEVVRDAFRTIRFETESTVETIKNVPFPTNHNYFPFKYDKDLNTFDISEESSLFDFAVTKTKDGFTVKREDAVDKVLDINIFDVMARGIQDQVYYNKMQPVLEDIKAMVNDRRYQKKAGRTANDFWRTYVENLATNGGRKSKASHFAGTIRNNLSSAVLTYKFTSTLIQPLVLINTAHHLTTEFGVTKGMKLFGEFIKGFTPASNTKDVVEESPVLQTRRGGQLELIEIQRQFTRKYSQNKMLRAFDAYQRYGFEPMKFMDMKTASPAYVIFRDEYMKQGMSEPEAIERAGLMVSRTQGSTLVAMRPSMMNSEVVKWMLPFQTFVIAWANYVHSDVVANNYKKGGVKKAGLAMMAYLPFLFAELLAEDELYRKYFELVYGEEEDADFGKALKSGLIGRTPLINMFANFDGEFDGRTFRHPFIDAVQKFNKGFSGVIDDPEDTTALVDALSAIGRVLGVRGTAQIEQIIDGIILR